MEAQQHLASLGEALAELDILLQIATERAQEAGHDPTDALRGLVISDDDVERLHQRAGLAGLWDGEQVALADILAQASPLSRLAQVCQLSLLDAYILLIALAPELDRRYERLYAFLQDDVSQRRPTVNLAMNLLGAHAEQRFQVWEKLQPSAPLRHFGLIDCIPDNSRAQASFLSYWLKVDTRLVAFLLGAQHADERLAGTLQQVPVPQDWYLLLDNAEALRSALPTNPLVYCQGGRDLGQAETAAVLCAELGIGVLRVDAARLMALDIPLEMAWRLALRESLLQGSALVVENWEAVLGEARQALIWLWSLISAHPYPVFLCGQAAWTPPNTYGRRLLRAQFSIPPYEVRLSAWNTASQQVRAQVAESDVDELASKFKLSVSQIQRAANSASDYAASRAQAPQRQDLFAAARAHASLHLGHLAQHVTPRAMWDDLILPKDPITQLRELCARLRYQHVVNDDWGFESRAAKGISALFAGDSGTGKTFAAEVIANELGLSMYKIDLSAVVSKYIGETEKNLSVIFSAAQSGNAILFFDEADAIFGKRSEVKDARDRYANLEIAYLLQEIEGYEGVVILATNFRQNLDDAFTRRLTYLIDFPFPDVEHRQRLWQAHFPSQAPLEADLDLHEIAQRYKLAGGNIRNAAQTAAYLAASEGRAIGMGHLRHAIRREHQKMGRLLED